MGYLISIELWNYSPKYFSNVHSFTYKFGFGKSENSIECNQIKRLLNLNLKLV